jgi:uncharacterized phage protein (TIGR01671 family)
MRILKFRAWDIISKKMYYNSELENGDMIIITVDGKLQLSDYDTYKIKDFVIMQYTGLKEKNGKKIYEGDIITFKHDKYINKKLNPLCFGIIKYCENEGAFYIDDDKMKPFLHGIYIDKIKGNIYENGDLL